MTYREELALEFKAFMARRYPNATEQERTIAWVAYQEGNARGYNDGMSAASQLEGGAQ